MVEARYRNNVPKTINRNIYIKSSRSILVWKILQSKIKKQSLFITVTTTTVVDILPSYWHEINFGEIVQWSVVQKREKFYFGGPWIRFSFKCERWSLEGVGAKSRLHSFWSQTSEEVFSFLGSSFSFERALQWRGMLRLWQNYPPLLQSSTEVFPYDWCYSPPLILDSLSYIAERKAVLSVFDLLLSLRAWDPGWKRNW